jgi:hypothetical protein
MPIPSPARIRKAPIYQVFVDSLTIHKKFIRGKLTELASVSHKPRRCAGAGGVSANAGALYFEKEETT